MAKKNVPGLPKNSKFLLYQTEDGKTRIEIRIEGETVWMTQTAMAELFQTTIPNINIHLKNIYDEGELSEKATIKDYLIVRLVSHNKNNMRHKSSCNYFMSHKPNCSEYGEGIHG